MPKWKSRELDIEAIQYIVSYDEENKLFRYNADEVIRFIHDHGGNINARDYDDEVYLFLQTINGWVRLFPNHYAIIGSTRFHNSHEICGSETCSTGTLDCYPCDPVTFNKRWMPALETTQLDKVRILMEHYDALSKISGRASQTVYQTVAHDLATALDED